MAFITKESFIRIKQNIKIKSKENKTAQWHKPLA